MTGRQALPMFLVGPVYLLLTLVLPPYSWLAFHPGTRVSRGDRFASAPACVPAMTVIANSFFRQRAAPVGKPAGKPLLSSTRGGKLGQCGPRRFEIRPEP